MKYSIAFAGLVALVSGESPILGAGCARDLCLRSVVASNVPTRSGVADCASFLKTTVTPAPFTQTETETTLVTTTISTQTTTTTIAFTTPAPEQEEQKLKRHVNFLPAAGGFKKVVRKREDDDTPGTAITVTNTVPSYISKGCSYDMLARYTSACSCVGVTPTTTVEAVPTILKTTTVPNPDTTSTVTPWSTLTATSFRAQLKHSSSVWADSWLATKFISPNTVVFPVPTPTPGLIFVLQPDGKLTTNGKRLVGRKSNSASSNQVRFFSFFGDTDTPTSEQLDATCSINIDQLECSVTPASLPAFTKYDIRLADNILAFQNPSVAVPTSYAGDASIQVHPPA